jgi:hypothetical protein
MSELDAWVDEVLADPLAEGRTFAQAGGNVIGFYDRDIPVELILAADALPVRLRGVPDVPTPQADRLLERSFGAEIRSIAEQWMAGAYDFMSAVVFPRTVDSAQRLYYYLCELQRTGACKGPRPLLYDLAKINRETSRRHSIASTQRLARELGSAEERLTASADRVQRRLAWLAAQNERRLADHAPAGSCFHRRLRAASHSWSARAERLLDESLRSSTQGQHGSDARRLAASESRSNGFRLLLVGSAPPDERFHLAVEEAGSTIVGEINEAGFEARALAQMQPCASIEAIALRHAGSGLGSRAFIDASSQLIEAARASQADGVIFWLIEEEEALVWELPAQVRALTASGVPSLVLTRQRWSAGPEVLAQVADFVRTLAVLPPEVSR